MPFRWVDLKFSKHAVRAVAERKILEEWVVRVVTELILRAGFK